MININGNRILPFGMDMIGDSSNLTETAFNQTGYKIQSTENSVEVGYRTVDETTIAQVCITD